MKTVKTADLGQGWFGRANDDGSFTIQSPDKGLRIDLTSIEAARFVDLYREARNQVRVSSPLPRHT